LVAAIRRALFSAWAHQNRPMLRTIGRFPYF
jgi:hypothetical protein